MNNLFFRGSRSYVHIADMLHAILLQNNITSPLDIDYTVMKPLATAFTCVAPDEKLQKHAVARFRCAGHSLLILPTTEMVTERVHDDETMLLQAASIVGSRISIPVADGQTHMARYAVAGFKRLLHTIFPEVSGPYKFVRLMCGRIWTVPFSIEFSRKIGGEFYEGLITTDAGHAGKLYFGVAHE